MPFKDADEAIKRVKGGKCRFDNGPLGMTLIKVPKPGVGIGTWGAVDFLTKHCGYVWQWEGR